MKHMGKLSVIIVLSLVGLAIAPATGSVYEATDKQYTTEKMVEIEIWDFTQSQPFSTIYQLPESKWTRIKQELDDSRLSSDSFEDMMYKQLSVLQNHELISGNVDVSSLKTQMISQSIRQGLFQKPLVRDSILNNSVISAMCAINFELANGTTFVFGLNTFINLIGFNIVSAHTGYSPTGIEAKGLLSKTTTPGDFFGFMFGFLGYWYGEKTGTGQYSSLTAAGFTFITAWFPVPELP
jgi:hypothetical protein